MKWGFRVFARALSSVLFICLITSGPLTASETRRCDQRPPPVNHRLQHIVDGDTVVLEDSRHIRLAGINAPELGRKTRSPQPLAVKARDYLRKRWGNKRVAVQTALQATDHYGRTLAYLSAEDGRDIGEMLIREGLAITIAVSPNTCNLENYQKAEAFARKRKRGVWAHPYYLPDTASNLTLADTGFRFVKGQISGVQSTPKYVRFQLADHVRVKIPAKYWPLFDQQVNQLEGKTVTVRGWVAARGKYLQIRVSHPYMMRFGN